MQVSDALTPDDARLIHNNPPEKPDVVKILWPVINRPLIAYPLLDCDGTEAVEISLKQIKVYFHF